MVGWVVLQWLDGRYCSGWVGGTAVVGLMVLQWLGRQYCSGPGCSGWVGFGCQLGLGISLAFS